MTFKCKHCDMKGLWFDMLYHFRKGRCKKFKEVVMDEEEIRKHTELVEEGLNQPMPPEPKESKPEPAPVETKEEVKQPKK